MTAHDPFASIRQATDKHRVTHQCGAYPYNNGSLLGVLAATKSAKRIVEVGTALGYTSLWFAHGAPQAHIDTIEFDNEHVRLARLNFQAAGVASRVTVHYGDAQQILPQLETNSYDLAFFDGFEPSPQVLNHLQRLLQVGGLLISGNLTLRGYGGDSSAVQTMLLDNKVWLTSLMGETALSIKQ